MECLLFPLLLKTHLPEKPEDDKKYEASMKTMEDELVKLSTQSHPGLMFVGAFLLTCHKYG
jgi:hypothetical protein